MNDLSADLKTLRDFADTCDDFASDITHYKTHTIDGSMKLPEDVWGDYKGRSTSLPVLHELLDRMKTFGASYDKARAKTGGRLSADAHSLTSVAHDLRGLATDLETTDTTNARDIDAARPPR
ncbi:MAG TPA: hypothetical protein VE172_18215 [Stackebrandtia sp.]|jgi:hypothetical protein|uniref:hypothetical protein n=1 Tax=Stackebrandtia sp. TaxID=2023065 RepID=UPI002D3A8AD2|nr:hypothetical protein [Stackebrandtia sp.]HZE40741.1 hypothetical protein [Stackebrandtia sp.]